MRKNRKNNEQFHNNFEFRYINQPIFNDIVIMDLGHERCNPGKPQVGPEKRDHISLHFVMSGSGFLVVNNKPYKVREGELFLTPCNSVCCYYPDKEDSWEYMWITFKGSKCMTLSELMGFTTEYPVYNSINKTEIQREFFELIRKEKNYTSSINLFAFSKLCNIACILNEERQITPDKRASKIERYVDSVLGYIERNYNNVEMLSLDIISSWIHLTPIYLNRIFKRQVGSSLYQYILNYRIIKAGELIENSEYSFTQIAQITGWKDYAQFSKAFKKHFGCSPSAFHVSNKN